jgi:hypothetical protein
MAVVTLAAGLFVLIAMALAFPGQGGEDPSGIAAEPSPVPRTTPSSPSSTAPSSPSTTPSAPRGPDPYLVALEASRGMHDAIEAARGKAGLKGHEAKDLEGSLDRFDRALDGRDAKAARDVAEALADAVADLVQGNEVSVEAGERLQAAVAAIVEAAKDLPA